MQASIITVPVGSTNQATPALLYLRFFDLRFYRFFELIYTPYTDGHISSYRQILTKTFDFFQHVPIGIQKQMIPHLKALMNCL